MFDYGYIIIPSIALGVLSRLSMLRVDYKQYPSYPQGVFSHITLGIIAASLGSVAIPALAEKEFAAVTFLSLAAQQFREVRNLERQSLDNIEPTELVSRGTAYIEDIAKAFEARNYVTMLTSLVVSLVIFGLDKFGIPTTYSVSTGIIAGLTSIVYLNKQISRQKVGNIADVKPAKISFQGPLLTVNDVIIMNVGLKASREIYLKNGIAVEIIPKDENAIATLSNLGQRQAIQHNAAVLLGIRKDIDEPDFTPLARRDPHTGNIVMAIVTMEPDVECLVDAVKRTIVLESAKRKPLESQAGEKAAD
ncbi:YIEGIA family protein [Caldisalinibacter kiritimatiensis]|uniref:Putative membrane protein n=1 Tax=Caldisalinibacter kiritimatiensis TaxID=1304284 RepID=R1AX78_9FIRM|nr:YIEGIA family protein [Caldisalinibacter kiritimatiensis]EOD01277.1 putative membrane protein [Caldisalinibacter kiritimatiensis]